MSDTFIRLDEIADQVVIDLKTRLPREIKRGLGGDTHRGLEAVAQLGPAKLAAIQHHQNMRDWEVKQAKIIFTRSLERIRDNSSPEYAIKFLEDTLAAVKG